MIPRHSLNDLLNCMSKYAYQYSIKSYRIFIHRIPASIKCWMNVLSQWTQMCKTDRNTNGIQLIKYFNCNFQFYCHLVHVNFCLFCKQKKIINWKNNRFVNIRYEYISILHWPNKYVIELSALSNQDLVMRNNVDFSLLKI